jgi:hypothetical protein
MKRVALALAVTVVLAGGLRAQPAGDIDRLREKADITLDDRQQIRAWLQPLVADLAASTDPELRRMIRARTAIVASGRIDPAWSPAYVQAFGEEALAMIEAAAPRAVSPEARLNLVMTVADLRRIEAIGFLVKVLTEDPYAATRYVAAKGLAELAPEVSRKGLVRAEEQVAQAARKAMEAETTGLTFYRLLEALGQFDQAEAHDALAFGVGLAATRLKASDPVDVQVLAAAVRALERAYPTEVRPDGRERLLTAYALLATWITPPVADPGLMGALNASLEKVTGARLGFSPGMDPVVQKLVLLEWVEKLVREKRIPKRPALPPAVEKVVERVLKGAGP